MKKLLSISAILAMIAVAIYVLAFSGNNARGEMLDQSIVTVQRRDINQSIIATGVIKPKVGAEVKVGAQVSGTVQRLYVRTGSKVAKNDLLAVIDPRPYRSQKNKMAALKEIAATELKYAELDFLRQEKLFQQASISQQQYESVSQRLEMARAKKAQAEADYEIAGLQLSYTQIRSPIDGVIASIATQEGETVAAGFIAPTFVTIIDLHQLEVWTYIDETDIGRIAKGQHVSFSVDTYPGEQFDGTVETIYPKPEIQNSVVNYVTIVSLKRQSEKLLRPEMTASVQVFLQKKQNVLTVPKTAVLTEANTMFVNVPVDGKSEKRTITTGSSDKNYYEVTSGLTEKEQVFVNQ